MSNAKLSKAIQNKVLKILKKDLRKELNMLMPELEIDTRKTKEWLKATYFNDLDAKEQTAKANEAFKIIIGSFENRKMFAQKKGVKGKPNVFYPEGSNAKDKYAVVSRWKKSIGPLLDEKLGVGKDFGSDFHLGHGKSSIPTVGYRHVKAAKLLIGAGAGSEIIDVIRDNPLIKDLKIDSEVDMVFKTNKSFNKKYAVRLLLQLGSENIGESAKEKAAHKLHSKKLIDVLEKIAVEGETSPSSIKVVSKEVTRMLKGKKKGRNKRSRSKASNSYKNPKKGKEVRSKSKIAPAPLRTNKGKFTSAMNIQAILDQRIKQQVQDNMGEGGALVNRTGRFASSVSVEKVMQSRQGTLTAFYTYMKAPYQTFERGYAQGTARRDPRKLIAASIREIARETLNHKLQIRTRRV